MVRAKDKEKLEAIDGRNRQKDLHLQQLRREKYLQSRLTLQNLK